MKKMIYEQPNLEISMFHMENIITTSGTTFSETTNGSSTGGVGLSNNLGTDRVGVQDGIIKLLS